MKSLSNLLLLSFIVFQPLIAQQALPENEEHVWNQANKIAERIMIIDCHSHSLFSYTAPPEGFPREITFPLLHEGRVKGLVQGFPVFGSKSGTISERIFADMDLIKARIKDESLDGSFVLKSGDFYTLQKKNTTAIMIMLENFEGICEGNINLLSRYYNEGVRQIGFYSKNLDALYDNENLSKSGIDYIHEMNRLGIICDITHILEALRGKVIEESRAPVILSHANSISIVESGNNATDATIAQLVKKGGMICVSFNSGRISQAVLAQMTSEKDPAKWPRAGIDELIDHIDYLKKNFGIDAIGIGSDYGGTGRTAPKGLETIAGFPLLIYHMVKRGYSESEIEKVMGLNFIRLFERVEKKALLN
jgi:membrane dipeptidase